MFPYPSMLTLRKLAVVLVSVFCLIAAAYGAGQVDLSFNPFLTNATLGKVTRTIIQPDGKIIATGEFAIANGSARTNIVRFNVDGTLDHTFNAPAITTPWAGPAIKDIWLQSDGKIVIAGQFFAPSIGIARLNSDGTPDTVFNSNPQFADIFYANDIKLGAEDKIILASARTVGAALVNHVSRLDANGLLEADVEVTALRLALQPDGKVLFVDPANIVKRLNADLSNDSTFTQVAANGTINEIEVQPDGKLIVGGNFTTLNGLPLSRVARVNANGAVDTSFNFNVAGANAAVNVVERLSDGRIFVGGIFDSFNGMSRGRAALLNAADGSLDPSYVPSTIFREVFDIDVRPDARILISGSVFTYSRHNSLVNTEPNGGIDAGFQTTLGSKAGAYDVSIQPDDKIIVGGVDFSFANIGARQNLARFNSSATLDTSFVPATSGTATNVVTDVFPDGKVLSTYDNASAAIFDPQGAVVANLTMGSGAVRSVKALPDGRSLVSFDGHPDLKRFNANGTLDTSFQTVALGSVRRIVTQPDGKILVAGIFSSSQAVFWFVRRLNENGSDDGTFNQPTVNNSVGEIALQPDGKIIIGGEFTTLNSSSNYRRLARLNANGTVDNSFAPNISQADGQWVSAVELQSDGKILIAGRLTLQSNVIRQIFARLNSNGSIDTTFTVGTTNGNVYDIDLLSNGKIVMVGSFTKVNDISRTGIVLISTLPAPTPFDFDGDGRADVSVFRASEGRWYILQSADLTLRQVNFAIAGDIPAPADFDGDGKTDIAIYRPSNGDWWSISSISGQQVNGAFGLLGNIPLPQDYTGDGRADYVTYNTAERKFYRVSSANGSNSDVVFGLAGDKPVIGDFNGDGIADPAIYRPSDGNWWWKSSGDGIDRATKWGLPDDKCVPADYTGDGRTDFGIYRPSTGVWYIYDLANNSSIIYPFGTNGDKPVSADFDGDGRADTSVFRPSDGIWYLLRSTSGYTGYQWGIATDAAVPNVYVPQ